MRGGAGFIHGKGWAYDPDNQDYSIDVAVYIFTDQNCIQSSGYSVYNANKERTDVSELQNIPGNHGFEFDLPIDAGNYWLKFVVYNKDNTDNTILGPYPVTVTASQTGTVRLTSQSGIITLGNGATLTGKGGEYTRVSIAAGATVTLDGVTITDILNDNSHKWAGITCLGNATIILAEGTNNIVHGSEYCPGIQVGPANTTLTIRGSGSLNANSYYNFAAGIGSALVNGYDDLSCGNIVIEGGNITAYGGTAPAIGGSTMSSCGTITITGGNVYAESSGQGPGIGCTQSTCAGITITGGTVTAKSVNGPAIGSSTSGTCNNITISGICSVTAESSNAANSIGTALEGTCGTITIGGVVTGNITQNPYTYAPTDIPYTVTFNSNYGTPTETTQVLYSNTPQALTANTFARTGYDFIGWNTKADGSGTDYSDRETVYNLGTVTLYAQWQILDYNITYNLDGGTNASSNPVTYTVESDAITLADPVRVGFTFDGVQFIGTNSPLTSTAGRLLDAHNPDNGACRAALGIDESLYGGLTFNAWFTDAGYNNPATTIPFGDDGTVILYPKFTDGTTSVAFAKEGYSTYYNGLADAILPAGVKARIVTANEGEGKLTYQTIADGDTENKTVPKGTAVMLQTRPSNAAQSIEISLASPTVASISASNLLHGSDAAAETTGGATYYKLSYGTDQTSNGGSDLTDVFGWYWGADNGEAFTSAAHKAWLALPSNNARGFAGLPDYDDDTMGIADLRYDDHDGSLEREGWYSLDGRRLSGKPSAKGVYINNGRKVVIK